jgi:hypothetical protein
MAFWKKWPFPLPLQLLVLANKINMINSLVSAKVVFLYKLLI